MDVISLIRAFFTSPGPGGVVVLTVLLLACAVYFLLTRWILAGGESEEPARNAREAQDEG